jgi:hypothetical protein
MEIPLSDPFFLTLSNFQREELTKLPWQKITTGIIPPGNVFIVNQGVCTINETGGSIYPGVLSGSLPFLKQGSFNFSIQEGTAFSLTGAKLATFLRTHPMLFFQYLNDARNKGKKPINSETNAYPKITLIADKDSLTRENLETLLSNIQKKTIIVDITRKGISLFEKLNIAAPSPALMNDESEHAESARRSIERSSFPFSKEGPVLMNLQFLSPFTCSALEWAILLHELKDNYNQIILFTNQIEEQWCNSAQANLISPSLAENINHVAHSGYWSLFRSAVELEELLSTFWNFRSIGLHESMSEVPQEELDVRELPLLFPSAIADFHLPDSRSIYQMMQPVYPKKYFLKRKKSFQIKARLNFFLPYKQNNMVKIRYVLRGQDFPATALYLAPFLKSEENLMHGCDGNDVHCIVQKVYGLNNINIKIYSEKSKSNFPGIITRNFGLESYKYGKIFQKR